MIERFGSESIAVVSPMYLPTSTTRSQAFPFVTSRISGNEAYPFPLATGTTLASTTRM